MSEQDRSYSAAGFKAGNNTVWEAFVTSTQGSLKGTLVKNGVRGKDLEDAMQDTYLRTWQHREEIDLTQNIGGYVNMVGRNLAIDRHRKASSRLEVAESDTKHDEEGQTAMERTQDGCCVEDEVLGYVYQQEVAPVIQDALDHILPQQATVVTLRAKGLTQQEIAEQTGMPLGTVKSRECQGRKNLRRILMEKL